MQAVLPGAPRAPVRLLHAGDDHGGGRVPRGEPAAPARRRSGTASRATSAAAPATRTSSRPSRPWPDPRRPRWRPPKARPPSSGSRSQRKEDPELITGRARYVDDITRPGHALGLRGAQPVRARAHQRHRRLRGARHGGLRGGVQRRRPGRRVGGPAGLRLAGHRRHQDERALAARQGQGPLRRRRRRRGGGRHRASSPRTPPSWSRSTGSRCRPSPTRWRPWRTAPRSCTTTSAPTSSSVWGFAKGDSPAPLQVLEAVLRRPGPREDQAAASGSRRLIPNAMEPRGVVVDAQRGDGRVHDVHGEPDPAHRAHHPGHHLRHPGGQAARGRAGRGRRLRLEARHVRRGVDLPRARPAGSNRPIKWTAERSEDYVATIHGRDLYTDMEMAATRDGVVKAVRATVYAAVGAYHQIVTPGIQMLVGLALRRPLRRRGLRLRVHERLHQHHAHRRLPRRRAARGHLRHRAHDGPAGARARDGPGRAAAQELHPDRELPQLHDRERPDGRLGRLPAAPSTRCIAALDYADVRAPSRPSAAQSGSTKQIGIGLLDLDRDVRPRALAGAARPQVHRRRLGRGDHRDAPHRHRAGADRGLAARPGARDHVLADRRRPARRRLRGRRGAARRHPGGAARHGHLRQPRRWPSAASPCTSPARRSSRRRARSRPTSSSAARTTSSSPTATSRCAAPTARPTSRRSRSRLDAPTTCPTGWSPGSRRPTSTTRPTSRGPTARTRAWSRSTPRPGRSTSSATSRWTTAACVINPMVVEGQVHGGVAQGIAEALFEEAALRRGGQPPARHDDHLHGPRGARAARTWSSRPHRAPRARPTRSA